MTYNQVCTLLSHKSSGGNYSKQIQKLLKPEATARDLQATYSILNALGVYLSQYSDNPVL